MKCPLCKELISCATPCDYQGQVVEACFNCMQKLGLKVTTRVWYMYTDDGRIPQWKADIPTIK